MSFQSHKNLVRHLNIYSTKTINLTDKTLLHVYFHQDLDLICLVMDQCIEACLLNFI
jgi:hypothetical protein